MADSNFATYLHKVVASVLLSVIFKVCDIPRYAWMLQLLQCVCFPLKQVQLLPIRHALQGKCLDCHQLALCIAGLENRTVLRLPAEAVP